MSSYISYTTITAIKVTIYVHILQSLHLTSYIPIQLTNQRSITIARANARECESATAFKTT